MQTTICLLQQQLKETKDLVSNLQAENANMCALVANQQPASQQPQQPALQKSQQPAPQQSQQPTPQQPQHYAPQQPQQPALQQPQHYDPAPQPPQHYDRVQATGSSSSVDRTTDAAQTPPHEAVARTTHAADSNSAEMAAESEHVPMDSDDACFGTQPPPTLHIKVEVQPTSPVAHSYEACTQLVDARNGRRTTDELDNRTEDEQVECPTTNGQTPTELSQLDDRSPCRRADETQHRLHDDEILEDPRLNSRSPDYDTDGTDISSDAWSPRSPPPPPTSTHHKLTKQLHHGDTAMSDDDDMVASPDHRSLQTDNSGGTNDVVLNGIAGALAVKEEPNI